MKRDGVGFSINAPCFGCVPYLPSRRLHCPACMQLQLPALARCRLHGDAIDVVAALFGFHKQVARVKSRQQ